MAGDMLASISGGMMVSVIALAATGAMAFVWMLYCYDVSDKNTGSVRQGRTLAPSRASVRLKPTRANLAAL